MPITVNDARKLGQRCGLRGVLILSIQEDGRFGVTTWGRTRRMCDAMWRGLGERVHDQIATGALEVPEELVRE